LTTDTNTYTSTTTDGDEVITEAAWYSDNSVVSGACPITCTWDYSDLHSDYPTNDMPNRLDWNTNSDVIFALTLPKGGWTYKRTTPFYANMEIKCDNKFA
jgi:hypothetical protein